MKDTVKLAASTSSALKAQGFPPKMTQAFLDTATATDCVVMTRVPGGATTDKINARYDLKGYFIKAKSCDWGPMAGFLCESPALNKKGADNLFSNADANRLYLDKLANFLNLKTIPFRQIEILDSQRKKIEEDPSFKKSAQAMGSSTYVGIASAKNGTAFCEFMMSKDNKSKRWLLYHGDIYVKADNRLREKIQQSKLAGKLTLVGNKAIKRQNFLGYESKEEDDKKSHPAISSEQESILVSKRHTLENITLPARKAKTWTPIRGITNPYPPFEGDEAFRNTVSGDFDLFAVWPRIPPTALLDCQRISENHAALPGNEKSATNKGVYAFLTTPGKRFTLESTRSRHLYFEFIPGFDKIGKLEDPQLGNINDAVANVVALLNSFVAVAYQEKATSNVAFHSDEGGRPGVADVDYPFAVFLPEPKQDPGATRRSLTRARLNKRNEARIYLIQDHIEFLDLIAYLYGSYFIFLNYGWVVDFLKTPTRTSKQTPPTNARAGIKKRMKQLIVRPYGDSVKLSDKDRTNAQSIVEESWNDFFQIIDKFNPSPDQNIKIAAGEIRGSEMLQQSLSSLTFESARKRVT